VGGNLPLGHRDAEVCRLAFVLGFRLGLTQFLGKENVEVVDSRLALGALPVLLVS
jgi:hypothetical protein